MTGADDARRTRSRRETPTPSASAIAALTRLWGAHGTAWSSSTCPYLQPPAGDGEYLRAQGAKGHRGATGTRSDRTRMPLSSLNAAGCHRRPRRAAQSERMGGARMTDRVRRHQRRRMRRPYRWMCRPTSRPSLRRARTATSPRTSRLTRLSVMGPRRPAHAPRQRPEHRHPRSKDQAARYAEPRACARRVGLPHRAPVLRRRCRA